MQARQVDESSESLLKYFLGFARVQIRNIEYYVNDEENVCTYLESFQHHGCSRLDTEHHVSSLIDRDLLFQIMESRGNSASDFYDTQNPPLLPLEPGHTIKCVRGHDLLGAAQRFLPPGQRWWLTKLYSSDLPRSLEDRIRQNYSINEPASDDTIFRSFLLGYGTRTGVLARTKLGSDTDNHYIKQVDQNHALRSALKDLAPYPGLWGTFTYRKLEYIVSPRCDEEIIHYLTQIYEFWSLLFPADKASSLDAPSIARVEGRMPRYSLDDRRGIIDGMSGYVLFPRLDSGRERVLEGLLAAPGRILTLNLLFFDAICLGPPARALRDILPIPRGQTIRKVFLANWRDWNGKFIIQASDDVFEESPLNSSPDDAEGMVALVTLSQLWLVAFRHYLRPRLGRTKAAKSVQPLLEIQGTGVLQRAANSLGVKVDLAGRAIIRDPNFPVFQHVTGALSGAVNGAEYSRESAFLSKKFRSLCTPAKKDENLPKMPDLTSHIPSDKSSYRCGRPLQREYQHDRRYLFLRYIYCPEQDTQTYPTSFAVMRDFFHCFFGRQQSLNEARQESHINMPGPTTERPITPDVPMPQSAGSVYPRESWSQGLPHYDAESSTYCPESPGEFRLTSVVSIPPHPDTVLNDMEEASLLAPGFEDQDSIAPIKRRTKIRRQINAKEILSEWFQARPESQDVVVFFLFKTHEYYKFRKHEHATIKSWVNNLAARRNFYFLAFDNDKFRTVEIENAADDAIKDGLLLVGDKSQFFAGGKSKDLMRGISQVQLDEYLEQFDVVTGRRRKRPIDEDAEEY